MPARFRRLALALPVLLALAVFTSGAPAPATAASSFTYDTYFWSAYERQVDSRTCTAASTAMMMNILAGRDRNFNQLTILRYAQPRDALNDRVQRGSDPLGWSRAATYFSKYTIRPTTYRWEAYSSEDAALKRAAYQIARYGKAVGLLVQHGRHAVVMTGFTSTRNPLRGSFRMTGVFYSDPLGSRHAYATAANSPLDTYLELDATREYDKAWYGKYIVIVPRD
jgi:hypothetical protein